MTAGTKIFGSNILLHWSWTYDTCVKGDMSQHHSIYQHLTVTILESMSYCYMIFKDSRGCTRMGCALAWPPCPLKVMQENPVLTMTSSASKTCVRMGYAWSSEIAGLQKNILWSHFKNEVLMQHRAALGRPQGPLNRKRKHLKVSGMWQILGFTNKIELHFFK